ncbi:pyocin knob domain-containing protein [Weissella confusa]|uniref:pyocin knob domain-containing protein n=1 Tax=Weissella confusa TaxID=1583 RepID=UPI0018F250FE|nr:pyocin knob domain-containing protein [Weissella confusa]MBJ7629881.1 hypothetical protein [Weissella confusa]
MANKFSSLIFTEEGKDVMTKALADKGQMSIINAYTFTVSLTKDLTYSQISGLNPKQTKPMGTVTTDLTTNTVESRLIIDNRDVTADYNLKGIAITGVYGTDNYVLGIINTNETTLVPAYNGQSAQTINLDVSFAISDTSIVTVNTQYAGMLTVADYIALQKYIDQRDAKKADDTATVHKTGNETINDIKTFLKIIVGSVSGNSGTSDRVNTLAINADVALSSLSNGVYLSTNASKTTSDKPTGAAETYVFVKESNVERFTDISNGQSYFRVKNGSTYTAWNRFSTAAELSNVDASAVHKTGNETIGGSKTFSSAIIANLQGNADTATKLKTARTISFSGAATGTGTFDGSGNVDIALTESATTRTNTSSSQSLAVGGTVTIIDSITTNTSGEITGVNVKTATMPSVYPPNNDSNLVHRSGAETIGGSKTFTDGISGALAGNATSATKLANARKINGENFDGSADINVDPVVQVISTNKDVFTLDNGFYYYSNVSATNKPSGSSNYFVVEVIQSGNNGFMQLVDSNNNAWWTTKTGGAWSSWKAVANDALVAHLDTAETFTGKKTFSAGLAGELTGNAATATTLKTARKIGGVSFDGTQDIDLAGVNKTGNQDTTGKAASADVLNTRAATFTDFADVAKNMKVYAGNWIVDRAVIVNAPQGVGVSYIVTVVPGTWGGNGTIYISDYANDQFFYTNIDGIIKGWKKVAIDSTVVHNTGSENISGAKNFFDVLNALSGIKGDVTGSLKGNADTATKWATARTLALTGDVTGSATIDGSDNVSIATTGSNLVHKTGNETIAGDKTFTGNNNKFTSAIDGSLKTREANFTDFATVANDMFAYAGNWFTKPTVTVANSPYQNAFGVVEVIPGDAKGSGRIIFTPYDPGDGNIYYNSVTWKGLGTWLKVANDYNVVHNTGTETVAGDKTFTGNVNVSGVVSSSNNYIEFGKPIGTPVISGTVTMWYGWKVYYYVRNGMVTYQFQATGSTIPAGTISSEKLPKAAIPIYKTFVPLAYGGQGFAINIDGSFENYTGDSISGASWASASAHVLNLW